MDPVTQLQQVLSQPASDQAVEAFRRGIRTGINKLAAAGVHPDNAKAVVANFITRVASARKSHTAGT